MKTITIQIPSDLNTTDQILLSSALQKIAGSLKVSNVVFLADIAGKPNADKKIEDNKSLIKLYL